MIQTASVISNEIGNYASSNVGFRAFEDFTQVETGVSGPSQLVQIDRKASVKLYPFTDFFKGFENVEAVRSIFGRKTEQVLQDLKVEFFSFKYGYMAVSDVDGHLVISTHHLKNSDFNVLYLDIIHELVHVKQFMDGRKLFDSEFEYVDNPTEIEAYQYTVSEARRIGMTSGEIVEYLKVEWLDDEMHRRLVEKTVGKVN
jgi:hypothetical protein